MALLRKGLQGEPVRRLQAKLGIGVDGIFGDATEQALRKYQEQSGLAVDGIAGPDTFAHMGLHELILLRQGSRGETVRKLQQALEIGADGIFGAGTKRHIEEFQRSHGLDVDGIAGPATLARLELFSDVTEKTVEMAKVPADYVEPKLSPTMTLDDATVAASKKAAEAARESSKSKGIWGTVKSWFS
jgi:peptidoglycan hydrolase-like protein with peptidoglycan-binding domain